MTNPFGVRTLNGIRKIVAPSACPRNPLVGCNYHENQPAKSRPENAAMPRCWTSKDVAALSLREALGLSVGTAMVDLSGESGSVVEGGGGIGSTCGRTAGGAVCLENRESERDYDYDRDGVLRTLPLDQILQLHRYCRIRCPC
jgi:hypothetical protein